MRDAIQEPLWWPRHKHARPSHKNYDVRRPFTMLARTLSPSGSSPAAAIGAQPCGSIRQMLSIVPTDCIIVPDAVPVLDVPALTADALANRPGLAQAGLQVQANELAASGSRNGVKPLLNLYANVQTRGSSLVPYQTIGSTGNEIVQFPPALTNGGLWLSTYIRQAFNSTQLTLAQPHRPIGRSARPDTTTPCRKSQSKARQ
jgi:hypothetical protein